jgi:RNA polymerase sigma-70 factor (ECF subfamily)
MQPPTSGAVVISSITVGEMLSSVFKPREDPLPRSLVEILDRLEAIDARVEPAPGALSRVEFRRELESALPHLRAFARSLTRNYDQADDIVQDTMLKAWAARDRFQAGTSFRAWTFTILRNVFISGRRRARFQGDWDELLASKLLSAPAGQEHRLHLTDLVRALERISPTQREALMLTTVGDLSHEEAAEIMGVATGTIKSRVSRAREALDTLLGRGGRSRMVAYEVALPPAPEVRA